MYVSIYVDLNHIAVEQKLTKQCKSTIPQLKIILKKRKDDEELR